LLAWSAAAPAQTCRGDCDFNGAVTVDELVLGVNVALDAIPVLACATMDSDDDGHIAVNEIVAAVGYALDGCPASCTQISLGPTAEQYFPRSGGDECIDLDSDPRCCWSISTAPGQAEPLNVTSAHRGCGATQLCFSIPPAPAGEATMLYTAFVNQRPLSIFQGGPIGTCTANPCNAGEVSLPGCRCRTPTPPQTAGTATASPTLTPTPPGPTPACAPTGTPYCSDQCQPCPTIRENCYANACGACIQNPTCGNDEVRQCPGGTYAGLGGCCGCEPPTPTPTPPPLLTPTCAPTGTPYCSNNCQPCPTIRPGCYANACGACIPNPACGDGEVQQCPGGPSGFLGGCCRCATPTPTPSAPTRTITPTPNCTAGPCPDLVPGPVSVFFPTPVHACLLNEGEIPPLFMEVCVDNIGDAPAAPFNVFASAFDNFRVDGLLPQAQRCERVTFHASGEVIVDFSGEVRERDETNNRQPYSLPIPSPPIACTRMPTPSPTPPP
jgi:hypothetical protein